MSAGYTLPMSALWAKRLGYGLLWAAFAYYAFRLAPADTGHDASFQQLMTGHGPARNPVIFAAFNLLGVIPLMYWGLMVPDGRGQRVWAWPFAAGMMALGSFALLPYLAVRRPYKVPSQRPVSWAGRWFGGRAFGIFTLLALVGLLAYGIGWGEFADYAYWFRVSNLINTFTVDFVLLALLFPALLKDDFARRGVGEDMWLARLAVALPLLGPAVYLALRPAEMSAPRRTA